MPYAKCTGAFTFTFFVCWEDATRALFTPGFCCCCCCLLLFTEYSSLWLVLLWLKALFSLLLSVPFDVCVRYALGALIHTTFSQSSRISQAELLIWHPFFRLLLLLFLQRVEYIQLRIVICVMRARYAFIQVIPLTAFNLHCDVCHLSSHVYDIRKTGMNEQQHTKKMV